MSDPSSPTRWARSGAHVCSHRTTRIDADLEPTANIDGVDQRVDIDVAVLDTAGFNNHPDVNVWAWCNVPRLANNSDDQGHGTHVGGAIGPRLIGIGVVGVAPEPGWNIRVLRRLRAGGGSGMMSWLICGLDIVRQHAVPQADGLGDIEVANGSFGMAGNDSNCQTQVDAFHGPFCRWWPPAWTVVVAVMNDAQDASNVVPATYEEVITVSALADLDGQPVGWDRLPRVATGPWPRSATSAPNSTSHGPRGRHPLHRPDGTHVSRASAAYRRLNGTSMASPQ